MAEGETASASHLIILTFIFLALRIEWCKAKAHGLRWREEVELVQEEMHQVIIYLQFKVNYWMATMIRSPARLRGPGHCAYCLQQERMYLMMMRHFEGI
jgi:hypothetical protein